MKEKFIDIAKEKYKSLEKIFCPYFEVEVHCTSAGFKHLIYKGPFERRSNKEIKARMKALDLLKNILEKSGTVQEVEEKENGLLYFGFISIIEKKKYKVVVSKVKDGRYVFVSIIPRWKTSARDENLKSVNL